MEKMTAELIVPYTSTDQTQPVQRVLFGWFQNNKPLRENITYSIQQVVELGNPTQGVYVVDDDGGMIYNPFGINVKYPFVRLWAGTYQLSRNLNSVTPVLVKRSVPFSIAFDPGNLVKAPPKRGTPVLPKAFSIDALLQKMNGRIIRENQDSYVVVWDHRGGMGEITSHITKDGRVIQAGFCVSGMDNKLHADMLLALANHWQGLRYGARFAGFVTEENAPDAGLGGDEERDYDDDDY